VNSEKLYGSSFWVNSQCTMHNVKANALGEKKLQSSTLNIVNCEL